MMEPINRVVRGLHHVMHEERVREQCLEAEKVVVISGHSHFLEKAKPRSFAGVTMEKTKQ